MLPWPLNLLPDQYAPYAALAASLLVVFECLGSFPQFAKAEGAWEKLKALPLIRTVVDALEQMAVVKPKV